MHSRTEAGQAQGKGATLSPTNRSCDEQQCPSVFLNCFLVVLGIIKYIFQLDPVSIIHMGIWLWKCWSFSFVILQAFPQRGGRLAYPFWLDYVREGIFLGLKDILKQQQKTWLWNFRGKLGFCFCFAWLIGLGFWDRVSVFLAELESLMSIWLALNSQRSSNLSLLHTGIKGVHHQTWFKGKFC